MSERNTCLSASACVAIAMAAPMMIAAQSYPADVAPTSAGHREDPGSDAIGHRALHRLLRGDAAPPRRGSAELTATPKLRPRLG